MTERASDQVAMDDPALAAPLALPTLLNALGIREADALAIYCGGSRLWGYSRASSDYDIFVVHASKDPALRIKTTQVRAPVKVDAVLMHRDAWVERLEEHKPLETLLTLYHPRPWLYRLPTTDKLFAFQFGRLRDSLRSHAEREVARVRKYLTHAGSSLDMAKATLQHLLCLYEAATQIVDHGRVQSFSQFAPALRDTLFGIYEREASWWEAEFMPQLYEFQRRLEPVTSDAAIGELPEDTMAVLGSAGFVSASG